VLTGRDLGAEPFAHKQRRSIVHWDITSTTTNSDTDSVQWSKLRVSLGFGPLYWGLMVTRVCRRSMWSEIRRERVSPVNETFSVPASISEDRFTNCWRKASYLRFWLPGLGELEGCLICILQLDNSHTCYISVKLKFGLPWVQKDPAEMTAFAPVKIFRKGLVSCFPLTWIVLLASNLAWAALLKPRQRPTLLKKKKD
jgi:hypothetical protein